MTESAKGSESKGLHQDNLIYVCQPSYCSPNPFSTKQFWMAHTREDSPWQGRLKMICHGGSLLANTFNQFWCDALNLQEAGEDIRYFAMLHDDIVPDAGWLDTLMEDLLSSGADLLAAVVPLKDTTGVTSTAIDNPNDPFKVERRLTMREVYTLPSIFDSADCGFPDRLLLANTGCWVCRFDRDWRKATNPDGSLKIHFTINDQVRKTADGKWRAFVDPEDWNFSRQVGQLGGKVMCSRRVGLSHYGFIPFSNRQGNWGDWTHDWARTDSPIVPQRQEMDGALNRFSLRRKMLLDVYGWLTDAEGSELALQATNREVLEIGSFCGLSTIWMGRTAQHVHTIDPHDGRATTLSPVNTLELLQENVFKYGLRSKVSIYQGTGKEIVPKMFRKFDMVFIDGDHSEQAVEEDIRMVLPCMNPGGLLCFHDYRSPQDPGVSLAVDRFLASGKGKLIKQVDFLAVVQLA